MNKSIGAALLGVVIASSPVWAEDFHCPPTGTRLGFNNRAPVEIAGQDGFVCLVKGTNNDGSPGVFRMLLGLSAWSAWEQNHAERLFPFKVGNEVEFTSSGDSSHIAANLTETTVVYYHDTLKVLREEKLATPAGTLDTWVIEDRQVAQGRPGGTWVTTYWFAPEIGYTVKRTFVVRAGLGTDATFELTMYLAPTPASPPVTSSVTPPQPIPTPAPPAPASPPPATTKTTAKTTTATPATKPSTQSPPAAAGSPADRLQALKDALDRKLITPAEYEAKRKAILDAM